MKRIKIIQPGYETYSGFMGQTEFENGVSVLPLPDFLADRITSNIVCELLDDDGESLGQANPAARLVGGATIPAVTMAERERATQEELDAEQRRVAEAAKRPPVEKLYTKEELEKVADDRGIKGLREIGEAWRVKGRAIPDLIVDILQAQGEFQKRVQDAEASEATEQAAKIEKAKAEAAEREADVSANARNLEIEAAQKAEADRLKVEADRARQEADRQPADAEADRVALEEAEKAQREALTRQAEDARTGAGTTREGDEIHSSQSQG